MKKVVPKEVPLPPNPSHQLPLTSRSTSHGGLAQRIHRVLFGLFLVQFALVWVNLWLPVPGLGSARWPDGLLLVLATATTLASLARQLPGQNVMLASMLIAIIGGAVPSVGAIVAIPVGPSVYGGRLGPQFFCPLRWAAAMLWLVAILTSRGVAGLILGRWRARRDYGLRVIGLSAILAGVFELGLEPFATEVKRYWLWHPAQARLEWYGTPWISFLGSAAAAMLILVAVTPALINKKPVEQTPQYHPLMVWVLMNLLFATGAAARRLWQAAVLALLASLVVAAFATRARGRASQMG